MYIVVEGAMRSGKTSLVIPLVEWLRESYPTKRIVVTREPGGDQIAEEFRRVVQATPFSIPMHPIAEAYGYASPRAQSLRSVVKPNLDAGAIVVSDRSVASSLSYQGYGLGVGFFTVLLINAVAVGTIWPDLVLYLDVSVPTILKRLRISDDSVNDKHESRGAAFFERVLTGYSLVSRLPMYWGKWHALSADGTKEAVLAQAKKILVKKLPKP